MILTSNLDEQNPETIRYTLSSSENLSPNIAQEKLTGRFFVYDNNGNILVFSAYPTCYKTKPLLTI